jgi:hypothetical protein
MRFADVYAARVAEAADDIRAKANTTGARQIILRWKLGQATAAYVDATGPNPVLNALDTVVLATLSRMIAEDYLAKAFGDDATPLLEIHRRLEMDAWSMARGILKPGQQEELRGLIREWRRNNPDQHSVEGIRFQEFVAALGKSPRRESVMPTSIFSLLFLDPLAGLDPTAAALEETRLLGERAVYYTQRLPNLLSWQTELLALQLADQPESKQVLSNTASLAASADAFSKTAEQLPTIIAEQREAAIRQVLDGLVSEDSKMRVMLGDARQTFGAGRELADSVDNAIASLHGLLVQISSEQIKGGNGDSTNARPFDVLDYGKAAGQIGAAAGNIQSLLASLKDTESQWSRIKQEGLESFERGVRHVFWWCAAFVVVLAGGLLLAALSYRVLTAKLVASKVQNSRTK